MYYKLYSWVRFKILPPRTVSLTRLWVEKNVNARHVWVSFGLLFRNERWSNFEAWNITPNLWKQGFVWYRFGGQILFSFVFICLGLIYYASSGHWNLFSYFLFSIRDFFHYFSLLIIWYVWTIGSISATLQQSHAFWYWVQQGKDLRGNHRSFLEQGELIWQRGVITISPTIKNMPYSSLFPLLFSYTRTLQSIPMFMGYRGTGGDVPCSSRPTPQNISRFWLDLTLSGGDNILATRGYWQHAQWLFRSLLLTGSHVHMPQFSSQWKALSTASNLIELGMGVQTNLWQPRIRTQTTRRGGEYGMGAALTPSWQFLILRLLWVGRFDSHTLYPKLDQRGPVQPNHPVGNLNGGIYDTPWANDWYFVRYLYQMGGVEMGSAIAWTDENGGNNSRD